MSTSTQLQSPLSILCETPQTLESSLNARPSIHSNLAHIRPVSPIKKRHFQSVLSNRKPHVRSSSNSSLKLCRTESNEIRKRTEDYINAVSQVKSTYAVMALIKMHLETYPHIKKFHVDKTFKKVQQFIHDNNSDTITSAFLATIIKKIQKNSQILQELHSEGAIEATLLLNQKNIETFKLSLDQILHTPNRLDKRSTHFQHTLIQSTSGRWFEQFKSYNLNKPYDAKAMRKIHSNILLPRNWTKSLDESPGEFTAILGSGGRGIVILARDLTDNSFWADKKSSDISSLHREYNEAKSLKQSLPESAQHQFIMMEHIAETLGSQTNDQHLHLIKGYGFMPIAEKPNQFYEVVDNFQRFVQGQDQAFINQNFELLLTLVNLDTALNTAQKLHPDFKLENIMGAQAGDLADLIGPDQPIPPNSWTPQYTMPRVMDKATLSPEEFSTFHRFSIGSSIIISNTGKLPATEDTPEELRLPFENQRIQRGYDKDSLENVPAVIAGRPALEYQKEILKLSKKMMADDRSDLTPEKFNLMDEAMKLAKYVEADSLTNIMQALKI